jgi:hypothetical protein
VEIAGNGAKLMAGQPELNLARPDLCKLNVDAAGPVGFNTLQDVALPLNRLRFLMLDCLQISLAELAKRHSTFRSIDLPLIVAQLAKIGTSDRGIRCF